MGSKLHYFKSDSNGHAVCKNVTRIQFRRTGLKTTGEMKSLKKNTRVNIVEHSMCEQKRPKSNFIVFRLYKWPCCCCCCCCDFYFVSIFICVRLVLFLFLSSHFVFILSHRTHDMNILIHQIQRRRRRPRRLQTQPSTYGQLILSSTLKSDTDVLGLVRSAALALTFKSISVSESIVLSIALLSECGIQNVLHLNIFDWSGLLSHCIRR